LEKFIKEINRMEIHAFMSSAEKIEKQHLWSMAWLEAPLIGEINLKRNSDRLAGKIDLGFSSLIRSLLSY
jgi:hypothetical protein